MAWIRTSGHRNHNIESVQYMDQYLIIGFRLREHLDIPLIEEGNKNSSTCHRFPAVRRATNLIGSRASVDSSQLVHIQRKMELEVPADGFEHKNCLRDLISSRLLR